MYTYHIYSSLVNQSNFSSLIHFVYKIAIDFQANVYSQVYLSLLVFVFAPTLDICPYFENIRARALAPATA